jgi:transcriptional regulator with XRE-family HTH domain
MSGADAASVPDDPVRGEDCQTVAVTITAQQCRMGRAALRLTQSRLASLAGITVLGLRDFELGGIRLHQNHRAALAAFLRAAGISFDGNKVEIAEKPQRGELQVRLMAPRGAVVHRGRTCPCNACVERRRLLELRRAARTVVDTVDPGCDSHAAANAPAQVGR